MKKITKLSTNAAQTIKKAEAGKKLKKLKKEFYMLQNLFYAQRKYSILILLQGMDTSGKDGTIRHVFSCINPQGCKVKSFKAPSEEELAHDFFWRIYPHLPEKGMIQIFNRSHYEDILYPVVHGLLSKKQIAKRFEIINAFEKHLQNNNTIILKFYLHISQKKQKERLEERITNPEKAWKYNPSDKKEAHHWKDYMDAYQNMINGSTESNPWICVPSDEKWYRNYFVANTLVHTLKNLKMKYPKRIVEHAK